jgi:hypothetical protein
MNTKQLVQTSANVIRIVNVAPGNLYKRFDLDGYDSDKTIYGIVNSVHNDGENTVIQATEYKKSYNEVEVKYTNITSKKDVVMFPCTIEEFSFEFEKVIDDLSKQIEKETRSIENKQKQIKDIKKLQSGELQKTLSQATYKELTQIQYNEAKQALN